jgi:hypothetical protein
MCNYTNDDLPYQTLHFYTNTRARTQGFIPLLISTFFYNIPICAKAFLDLLVSKIKRKDRGIWVKTLQLGNESCYIVN